ncbi:unnamed protein product [Pedinophyceae sp. YPF-701]|nr:unnamed protein product [Pedinophyceae sp. YPF-701]
MDKLKHTFHGLYKQAAESVMAPLADSRFHERGVLTPGEFVQAGDYLTQACPTWSWEAGEEKNRRSFLPGKKQFLVTRGVPCLKRAQAIQENVAEREVSEGGEDGGWVETCAVVSEERAADIDISGPPARCSQKGSPAPSEDAPDIDDVPDIADISLDDPGAQGVLVAAAAAPAQPGSNIVRTRTYDLSITYDKYYQTPRFWLTGYDEAGQALPPKAVYEDVSAEHAHKTITIESHPHTAVQAASIHPCKHADTMKRLSEAAAAAGKDVTVETYLVLFLKFIASICPTIEYDYTMSA